MAVIVETRNGCEVRALRRALRLSVEAFAVALGVSPRAVAYWEAGHTHPGHHSARELDALLDQAGEAAKAHFASQLAGRAGQAGRVSDVIRPSRLGVEELALLRVELAVLKNDDGAGGAGAVLGRSLEILRDLDLGARGAPRSVRGLLLAAACDAAEFCGWLYRFLPR